MVDEVREVVPNNVLQLHEVHATPNQEEAPRSNECTL